MWLYILFLLVNIKHEANSDCGLTGVQIKSHLSPSYTGSILPPASGCQKVRLMQPGRPDLVLHFKKPRYHCCHARPPIVRDSGPTGGHCQTWGWMSRWWAARWWPSLSGRGWAGDPGATSSGASRPWERDPVNRPQVRVRTAGSSIST